MPQFLYILGVSLFVFIFALFCRYFLWKQFADKHYWNLKTNLTIEEIALRAEEKGRELPRFSILIPARNEAVVIENTVNHLAQLNYPKDRLEIVVVSDQKELFEGRDFEDTTQGVVTRLQEEFKNHPNRPVLRHLDVPFDFDGHAKGSLTGFSVPSTKGRALNFALDYINEDTDICGFYDAESRPELDVLLFIATRWLDSTPGNGLWQGPVFQVRNFSSLSPITKIASLYQAIAHQWYLPVLMQSLPFVGGTNLFIERSLIMELGGYDHTALTEDLELGVRAYLEKGAWPEYFPYFSTEQTPETFKAFFRQRLRWGAGHLQVSKKFHESAGLYQRERVTPMLQRLFWNGQGQWALYQSGILLSVILILAGMFGQVDWSYFPMEINIFLRLLSIVYFGFTFYIFLHFLPLMDLKGEQPKTIFLEALPLLLLPLSSFLLPLPYTTALLMKIFQRQPQGWVKTPRTSEISRSS